MNSFIAQISEVDYNRANSIIRGICGIVDYFSSEDEKTDFISVHSDRISMVCEDRVSYGDWQTPKALADKVCTNHLDRFGSPDILIEPTCGLGSFVFSALAHFQDLSEIHALDINQRYIRELKFNLLSNALNAPSQKFPDIYIYHADFFDFDFSEIINKSKQRNWNLALIGNPPWVTNSSLGRKNSNNLPIKTNSSGLRGIDAITGRSNFDISEYITLSLLDLSQTNRGGMSFLLKNSVIRNILTKQKTAPIHIGNLEQGLIDAREEFDVSVAASCFYARFNCDFSKTCRILNFYDNVHIREYGWVNDSFVSNTDLYQEYSKFDNYSDFIWRSGIKHDCASVLELTFSDGEYRNGFGKIVRIEDDLIFPLLKSSDINHYEEYGFRKFIIVPQRTVGADTSTMKYTHPKAYSYLTEYQELFLTRKSSIYKGKDKFSIFGIGDYSFKPYKIAVSSLYKAINFILVTPYNGKSVMVDDTCYQLDFDNLEDAKTILSLLQGQEIQSLLKSLIFVDAKRVITKNLLMRLDLMRLCREKNLHIDCSNSKILSCRQLSLFD